MQNESCRPSFLSRLSTFADKFHDTVEKLAEKTVEVLREPLKKVDTFTTELIRKVCGENAVKQYKNCCLKIKEVCQKHSKKVIQTAKKTATSAFLFGYKALMVTGDFMHMILIRVLEFLENVVTNISDNELEGKTISGKLGVVITKVIKAIFSIFSHMWNKNPVMLVLTVIFTVLGFSLYSYVIRAIKIYIASVSILSALPYVLTIIQAI